MCSGSDCSCSILTWLDVLNSNQRRTWNTSAENWPAVREISNSSHYLEEEEIKATRIPNIVKDDLYIRKLSPVMPNPGNSFDQFLPKCWIPEDVNWKRIKRETSKPWYKEFQGFRFVFMRVSVLPVFIPYPDLCIHRAFFVRWRKSHFPSDNICRTSVIENICSNLNFRIWVLKSSLLYILIA